MIILLSSVLTTRAAYRMTTDHVDWLRLCRETFIGCLTPRNLTNETNSTHSYLYSEFTHDSKLQKNKCDINRNDQEIPFQQIYLHTVKRYGWVIRQELGREECNTLPPCVQMDSQGTGLFMLKFVPLEATNFTTRSRKLEIVLRGRGIWK